MLHANVDGKTREYIRQAQQTPVEIVTDADLAPLPEPVQRYLHYAQVVGKPRVRCAKARQTGRMRMSPTQNWMPVEAVQYSTLAGPLSRTWYARIKAGPLPLFTGADRYDNGAGSMQIRLLSLFPVVDAHGLEMDVSALIIFVNDMLMWPSAFLSDFLRWEPIDATAARLHASLHNREFTAELYFNAAGQLIDFVTDDRFRSVGNTYERTRWSTPLRAYREVNGVCIPTEGDAIWHLPEGEFAYIQVSIGEVGYDTFDFS
jgi:hypothetical protein